MSADKETTETLVERSQRILGVSLDSPESDEHSGLSHSHGRDRKTQVSQAQRTHRRRTQRYIRELENEVLRLRSRERTALDRVRTLEAQFRALGQDANENVIDPPPQYTSPAADATDFSLSGTTPTTSGGNAVGGMPLVSIDLTQLGNSQPSYACCDTASELPAPNLAYLNDIPNQIDRQRHRGPGFGADNGTNYVSTPQVVNLDTQAAVDFVLKLEEPCFPHIRFAIEKPNCRIPSRKWLDNPGGPDHALTATRSLLSASPIDSTMPLQPFEIPEKQVNDLLEASARLDLENELTPVQVWQKIASRVGLQGIDRGRLGELTGAFQSHSYCNSYGCVVNKMVAEIILGCFFPQYIEYYHSEFVEAPV